MSFIRATQESGYPILIQIDEIAAAFPMSAGQSYCMNRTGLEMKSGKFILLEEKFEKFEKRLLEKVSGRDKNA